MPLTDYHSLCEERQRIIVSRDAGQRREHRANNENRKRVRHYKIDGCVIRDDSTRCDYLLINEDQRYAYLIELKGSDIEHALEQLETTAVRLRTDLQVYTVKFRLVYSRARTQAIQGTKFKKFCRRHSKEDEFIYGEGCVEEII